MQHETDISNWRHAIPFTAAFLTAPLVFVAANYGGWTLVLVPFYGWWCMGLLDAVLGRNDENRDPNADPTSLFWYRLIPMVWFPIQFVAIFGALIIAARSGDLSTWEKVGLFVGVGVVTGSVGINFSHELMHQKSRAERWLADLLLASVLYGHFRSEHLLVHHTHVGTPRDAVTARYNEGFYRFFVRVLPQSLVSAIHAEADRQTRRGRSAWHQSNPFWRYAALQAGFVVLAVAIGGLAGLFLFALQAFIAVMQLELTNYIEHYGLVRIKAETGKYEPVLPRHSWNSTEKMSNWYLINLQRHSDHHFKPDRRFPLLQTYPETEAPALPAGYPVMSILALIPPAFRRVMNPRVRKWRKQFYPEIRDWSATKT